jgi:hypothetical protein
LSARRLLLLALAAAPATVTAQETQRVPLHGSSLTAPPRIAKALDPYRGNPDSAAVADLLADEARFTGFPTSSTDEVLVARLWGRAGVSSSAVAALDAIPAAETGSLARLERARILLETDADRAAGAKAYWAACETLDAGALPDVRQDLLAVSTPEERATWSRGPDDQFADCGWLREFWSERANRMAISTDERVALHYRRLAHAREWFWIARPRFSKSWADKLGRPDSLALDDRGLIYLRMGPPEADEGFFGNGSEGVNTAFEAASPVGLQEGPLVGLPKEGVEPARCWPYPRPDGYQIFCFTQVAAGMSAEYARGDGDYKLQEAVVAAPGSQYFQKYVMNSNLPVDVRRSLMRNVAGSFGTGQFGMRDAWELGLDRAERLRYDNIRKRRAREDIANLLEQVPDVPAIRPTVRLRVETLRFLNPSQHTWHVWALAGVRAGDLQAEPDEAGTPTLVAGGRFSIRNGTEVEIHELPTRRIPEGAVRDDDGILFSSVFAAPPGRLPLTVVVEDANRPDAGNYLLDTLNVPAIGGLPMVSDIAVAQETGGTWTRDGVTFLQVSPAHVANADGSIYTYFEVYQVRPGTRYQVEIRMAPVDKTDEILRLDPGDLDFRLQFTTRMSGTIGRHNLRLDLSDAPPGSYALAVRVQDVVTGAFSLPSITDVFIPEGGSPEGGRPRRR